MRQLLLAKRRRGWGQKVMIRYGRAPSQITNLGDRRAKASAEMRSLGLAGPGGMYVIRVFIKTLAPS